MPKVIIRNVIAVGMHHYSGELTPGRGYNIIHELNNVHDPNACGIVENGMEQHPKVLGHLKRDAAQLLSKVIDARLASNGRYYLKPKGRCFFHSRRYGKVQMCTAGFMVKTEDVTRAKDIVLNQGFPVLFP